MCGVCRNKAGGLEAHMSEPMVTEMNIERLPKPIRSHLRPVEIVERTGLSKAIVMKELYAGRLKGFRVGRAWLVPIEEVDRWIRGGDEDVAA